MPVTERIILPVSDGVDAWEKQVKFLLQTLKKQEGNIRTRWGPHSENENNLEFLIGWENKEAQAKFEASPDFESVMSQLKPILTSPPTAYFIEFKPYAPKEVIDATYVQMMTFESLAGSVNEDELRSAVEVYKTVEGCTGVASGFALDEVSGKGKPFVAVAGWNSLADSEKAKATLTIADGKLESHHVNFRFPVKGFRGL